MFNRRIKKEKIMHQVISPLSGNYYFSGMNGQCEAYVRQYNLSAGFEIVPFDSKRKKGDFVEQMQIQLGNYKLVQIAPELDSVIKKQIADIIQQSIDGIKRHLLLSRLNNLGYSIPDRKMRSLIEELINEDGFAIESSEDGYRIIKDVAQLKTAIKYLKNKAFPLFERANNLNKNFYRDKSKQLSFEEFLKD